MYPPPHHPYHYPYSPYNPSAYYPYVTPYSFQWNPTYDYLNTQNKLFLETYNDFDNQTAEDSKLMDPVPKKVYKSLFEKKPWQAVLIE